MEDTILSKISNNNGNIDAYINTFSGKIKERLITIRQIIQEEAPHAEEIISYQMPTYKVNNKPLVYFAAFKNHIGFYPTPSGTEKFNQELAAYRHGKGSVRFPLNEELPTDLIRKIVRFRVNETA